MRAILNVDDGHFAQESRLSYEASFALYVFTDGSARKISRKELCAGWGFTAKKSHQNRDEVPMVEACGPVQIAEGGEHYVGAIRATNNTVEMQALFWLNNCVEQHILPTFSNVIIRVDSLYVKVLTDEKFVARENRTLATLLCHMWRVTKKKLQLHVRWVRGHTCDVGNSVADALADTGPLLEAQHRWWKRVQPMGEWEEDVFQATVSNLQRGKHRVNKPFASSGQAR